MNDHWPLIRPRLVFSRCFGLAACRYDGAVVSDPWVARLQHAVEVTSVCPELACGLGVPRAPIRVVGTRLLQPSTGRDLTGAMSAVVADFARHSLSEVDGLVLKSRSPSCGRGDTRLFDDVDSDEPSARGDGLFAGPVAELAPHLAWTDEVRLADPHQRARFLARAWTLAAARQLQSWPGEAFSRWQLSQVHRLGDAHRETLSFAAERATAPVVAAALRALVDQTGAPGEVGDPWPTELG